MIYFVIAFCVAVDALSDGWRAKLQREWTVVLGLLGDLAAVGYASSLALTKYGEGWQANLVLCSTVVAVGFGRILQELWWRDPVRHKGTRFDDWHIAKYGRLYAGLGTIVALGGLSVRQVAIVAVGSWVLWRLSLMAARRTWDWRRPWG